MLFSSYPPPLPPPSSLSPCPSTISCAVLSDGPARAPFVTHLNIPSQRPATYQTGQPVLLMFNAAASALSLEALTDGQVLLAAMGVLQTLYGAAIPAYSKYLVTRWQADPYARGAYSYAKVGATNITRTAFAVHFSPESFLSILQLTSPYSHSNPYLIPHFNPSPTLPVHPSATLPLSLSPPPRQTPEWDRVTLPLSRPQLLSEPSTHYPCPYRVSLTLSTTLPLPSPDRPPSGTASSSRASTPRCPTPPPPTGPI